MLGWLSKILGIENFRFVFPTDCWGWGLGGGFGIISGFLLLLFFGSKCNNMSLIKHRS
jgi:hypothetical protein